MHSTKEAYSQGFSLGKALGTLLVLPLALTHTGYELVKELRKLLVTMKTNEYPVCSSCKHWREESTENYGPHFCSLLDDHRDDDEYCSRWEEQ